MLAQTQSWCFVHCLCMYLSRRAKHSLFGALVPVDSCLTPSLRGGRSALQGLLRKLGGGLEDIMPHRAAESNQRMKVCQPRRLSLCSRRLDQCQLFALTSPDLCSDAARRFLQCQRPCMSLGAEQKWGTT